MTAPTGYELTGSKQARLVDQAANLVLREAAAGHMALTAEEKAALESITETHRSPVTRLARLAASGRMSRTEIEVAFNQTRLMGRGVSRLILEMLLEKATRGDECPYDAKVLQFLAKGFGIVSPSKPIDDADRAKQIASAEALRNMSDQELIDDIQGIVKTTQDQARGEEDEARRIKRGG